MDNLELWNKVKQVPKEYLKPIQAGRLRGKSDINPQWRLKALTENLGPCGVGWKYEIVRLWSEPASEGQVFAFAEIKLYINYYGEWSQPIPGIGGSMLVEMESKGPHSSDEGYKMALTDALGVSMKALGVAADVYFGLCDSKYNKSTTSAQNQQEKASATTGKATTQTEGEKGNPAPDKDMLALVKYMNEAKSRGLTAEKVKEILGADTKTFMEKGNSAGWTMQLLKDAEPFELQPGMEM